MVPPISQLVINPSLRATVCRELRELHRNTELRAWPRMGTASEGPLSFGPSAQPDWKRVSQHGIKPVKIVNAPQFTNYRDGDAVYTALPHGRQDGRAGEVGAAVLETLGFGPDVAQAFGPAFGHHLGREQFAGYDWPGLDAETLIGKVQTTLDTAAARFKAMFRPGQKTQDPRLFQSAVQSAAADLNSHLNGPPRRERQAPQQPFGPMGL